MKLPENKRRNIESVKKRVIWIYGAPFCGKTTFANDFPDPLMLNTDGNFRFVDAPVIPIKDVVTVEGRQTKRKMAWEFFRETIDELEKKENTFKTIIVDLLEDTYEHCRRFMYKELGITHESDDSFRAWDKVRGEFLNTLKRLMNLDYENIILISHEDATKDITRKTGDKISSIKPNIQDKIATKVAGMVDVVARIVADNGVRTFNFKADEVIFGGGRLRVDGKSIPLSVDALFAVYDDANANRGKRTTAEEKPATGRRSGKRAKTAETPTDAPDSTGDSAPETAETSRPDAVSRSDSPDPDVEDEDGVTDAPPDDPPEEETGTWEPGGGEAVETEEKPIPPSDIDWPKCPDGKRIFRQNRESNGEIPLCPRLDPSYHCHREGGPTDCPLLDRHPSPEDAAEDAPAQSATETTEPPRRKRRARAE